MTAHPLDDSECAHTSLAGAFGRRLQMTGLVLGDAESEDAMQQ